MARQVGSVSVQTFFNSVDRNIALGVAPAEAYVNVREVFESEDAEVIEAEVSATKEWVKTQAKASKPFVARGKQIQPETLESVKVLFPNHYEALKTGKLDEKMKAQILSSARSHARVASMTPVDKGMIQATAE